MVLYANSLTGPRLRLWFVWKNVTKLLFMFVALCCVGNWHWLSESRKGVIYTYLLGCLKCCWWFHHRHRRYRWHFWPMNDLQQLFDFYPLHKFNSFWAAQKTQKHTRWSTHNILSRTYPHTQHCTTHREYALNSHDGKRFRYCTRNNHSRWIDLIMP